MYGNVYAGIAASSFINAKAHAGTYQEAFDFLFEHGRIVEIGSNVRLHFVEVDDVDNSTDSIAVELYRTDIIVYHKDGTFEADNGGYVTRTTITRMDQFGPHGWHFCHNQGVLRGKRKGYFEWQTMGVGKRFPVEMQPRQRFRPSDRFDTSEEQRAQMEQFRGQRFKILGEIPEERDYDKLYLVRFRSGIEMPCHPEEIYE